MKVDLRLAVPAVAGWIAAVVLVGLTDVALWAGVGCWVAAALLWKTRFALSLVVALFVSPSSTAVDRLGLYLIPLQLLVLSRIPDSFAVYEASARRLSGLVVLYSAAVMFVWLNFASHAGYWLPYRFHPF